jgi:uncharacterized repeat protein (TIGR01451 family)
LKRQSKKPKIFLGLLVTLAMLISLFGMAIPVAGDFDPADSNANSINLDLIRPSLEYHIGDTIYFSVRVQTPVADPAIDFYPGKNTDIQTSFTRPDGVVINFAVISELNRGEQVVFDYTTYPGLAYMVDPADADALGVVRAEAEVLAISHCSETGPAPGGNEYASNFREISTEITIEPCIEIEKLVDCNDDEIYLPEDTGSYGDTPSWYIWVHNCGDSPLHDVMVSDTNGMSWGPFNLDIGEEWEVYYDGDPIFETTTNEAMAEGLDLFDETVGPVYDSATNVVEPSPCIEILKLVDCNDDEEYLHEDTGSYGDTPTWYIKVTNCGDSPLLNIVVSDTNGMTWMPFDLMSPGDFWETYYIGDPIYETTTNTAEAIAEDVLGRMVGPVYDSATNVITGGEGCTPGFWKNNAVNWGASAWVGHAPGDSFECVFGVDVILRGKGKATYPAPTLLEALNANGGGINALARHAVAALLNIANPDIAYGIGSTAALIAMVQEAIAMDGDAIQALHTLLADYNEAGCPISQHWAMQMPD